PILPTSTSRNQPRRMTVPPPKKAETRPCAYNVASLQLTTRPLASRRFPMKITDIRLTGLTGGTADGGWPQGNRPEEDLTTVIEVLPDEGLAGVGSAMTSKALVAAGVQLLWPLLIGERADEPARVTEKLRQSTFWQGRGGAVEHAISGIDI